MIGVRDCNRHLFVQQTPMTMMIQIGNHSPHVKIVNSKCRPWLVNNR